MAVYSSFSPCKCLIITYDRLYFIDGEKVPFSTITFDSIEFEEENYQINKVFSTQTELLKYFNTKFVKNQTNRGFRFRGKFGFDEFGFYYSNPEQFTTAEIMITYGLKPLVFQIGTPPSSTQEMPFTATFVNGITEISHPELYDMQEVQVRIGNITSEPIVGQGHTYLSIDPIYPLNGKLEFPFDLYDTYIYVTLTQKPS